MTTIERPPSEPADRFILHPESDDPDTIPKEHADFSSSNQKIGGPMNDDMMMPIRPVSYFAPKNLARGSRTWSTHEYSLHGEIKPRPVVPIVTHHTAEKRAPFDMESG